jgi:hypothetical protein
MIPISLGVVLSEESASRDGIPSHDSGVRTGAFPPWVR